MEQLREVPTRPSTPPPAGATLTEAATDVAGLAGEAAARARAVRCAPAVVTVTVKTTGAEATEIVATRDTTLREIMTQACRDLGVRDAARYVLVARGEVVADGARTLGDLVGENLDQALTTRLVKKPEAGGAAACRS
jgi:hypothetical protein